MTVIIRKTEMNTPLIINMKDAMRSINNNNDYI